MKASETVQMHWLKRYALGRRVISTVAIAWGASAIGFYHTPAGDYLEAKIAAPVDFGIRHFFGRDPQQSSRLKILAVDDRTFAWLGTATPDLKLWADLIDGIAENKPKLIVVDSMFSAKPPDSLAQLKFYFSRLEELAVPVASGAFTSPVPLEFKTPLEMSLPWYSLKHYFPSERVVPDGRGLESHVPNWPVRDTWRAYGPATDLQPWFQRVGHIQLLSDHKIEPFMRLGENLVLPHISLFAADNVHLVNGNIRINNKRVALDRNGAVEVNFAPMETWRVQSLIEPLKAVKDGFAVSNIQEGDIVLILPLYFTGNTDFRPSPFGLIPGGLYIAAMLNSVLTGEWLQPVLAAEVITVIGVLLAAALVTPASAGFYWAGVISFAVILFGVSQALFIYFGLVIPWLVPTAAVVATAINLFILKSKAHEKKVQMLRTALEGAVDARQLDGLLRRPESIDLEPRERVVTLMFIDVVGFSMSAENMLPRLAFDSLKQILGDISRSVHHYGGVVDKSLGDGLLCYFGYRFDSDHTVPDHAEQALRCAIAIQSENLKMNAKALESGSPLYPLRIGINTASCYLGDLGTANRIEFTVVGNGVNFAKRLEGACEMFSVMMGSTTWELVRALGVDLDAVTRRLIRIKHHRELVDAFEYDPMRDQADFRLKINEAFRKSASLQRLNERYPVSDPTSISVTSEFGRGIIMNFSGTGISLQLSRPLARGSRVTLELDSPDGYLAPALKNIGIEKIDSEVRWNYQSAVGFVHGLVFQNFDETKAEDFVQLMCRCAYANLETRKEDDEHPLAG